MAFRFVHCADAHLDSPLRSLALRNPDLADLIGTATRRAFSRVVDLCLEERVDALLIAGDLYDGDQTSMKTALFLGTELSRLDGAGIAAFIIRGNHDNTARITRELVLPRSTTVFGGRAETITLESPAGRIAVHGLSFTNAQAPESLLPKYKPPVADAINVGLLHTSLGGAVGHDPYAPCTTADLESSGFRYWALGHIHQRSAVTGRCTTVMAGMPQGRDIGEAGPKGATLVTIADDGTITAEERRTSIAEFARIPVDVSGAADWRHVASAIGAALAAAREATASEHLVGRVELFGTSALAWRMRRDIDLLRTESEARAAALDSTWIDKVEIRVGAPRLNPQDDGPFGELRRSMMEEVCGSPGNTEAVLAMMDDVRLHLPPECRDMLGATEAATRAMAERLAVTGCDDLFARILPHGVETS